MDSPGYNQFVIYYDIGSGWNLFNNNYESFLTDFAPGEQQTLSFKIEMATTSSTTDPMTVIVTLKSVQA